MNEAVGSRSAGLFQRLFGSDEPRQAAVSAPQASALIQDGAMLFKALGHEGRLMILCHLVAGEKSVNELESLLDARQSAVSQQLARLRMEGIVAARREGQMIFYSICDTRVLRLLQSLDAVLAETPEDAAPATGTNAGGASAGGTNAGHAPRG